MKRVVSILIAALIIVFASVPAFAAKSPSTSKSFKIKVHNTKGGTGSYTTTVGEDGKEATITARPKKGYEFTKWVIKGKYDLLDGDLTDEELTILLKSDVHAYPYFKKIGSSSVTSQSTSQNSSPVSPQTGDTAPYFVFGALAAVLAAFAAVGVKLAVNKK